MLLTCISLLEIDDPLVVKRFHDAARKGDVSVIVKMLRDGVPVDCYYEDSRTALYWAVYYDGIDVVKVLLESGANVNRQDRNGRTPLIQAAINNNTDVMEVLLHHGADPSIVDVVERTALEWARMRYREEAIRLLEKILGECLLKLQSSWMQLHGFFISSTFISNARLKSAKKIKQLLNNTQGWTFPTGKLFTFFIHVIIQK